MARQRKIILLAVLIKLGSFRRRSFLLSLLVNTTATAVQYAHSRQTTTTIIITIRMWDRSSCGLGPCQTLLLEDVAKLVGISAAIAVFA